MCLSLFLAQVIGCFLLVTSFVAIAYPHRWKKVMGELLTQPPLLALSGSLSVLLGLLVVLGHNIWVAEWPVLITLVGWYALLQGLMRVFFPEAFAKMIKDLMGKTAFTAACWVWFVIGIYLTWVGFSQP